MRNPDYDLGSSQKALSTLMIQLIYFLLKAVFLYLFEKTIL
jgi:hypothetical protein